MLLSPARIIRVNAVSFRLLIGGLFTCSTGGIRTTALFIPTVDSNNTFLSGCMSPFAMSLASSWSIGGPRKSIGSSVISDGKGVK